MIVYHPYSSVQVLTTRNNRVSEADLYILGRSIGDDDRTGRFYGEINPTCSETKSVEERRNSNHYLEKSETVQIK